MTFTWQDLGCSEWREILRGIDDSTQAVYQFVWFAAQFLAIDVLAMVRTDPEVDDTAKDFVRLEFPGGAPRAGRDWEREILADAGVDPLALWKRLATEGAPMAPDVDNLE